MYNFNKDSYESLSKQSNALIQWHNARWALLGSITAQKLGLFHNQPIQDRGAWAHETLRGNAFLTASGDLEQLVKLQVRSAVDCYSSCTWLRKERVDFQPESRFYLAPCVAQVPPPSSRDYNAAGGSGAGRKAPTAGGGGGGAGASDAAAALLAQASSHLEAFRDCKPTRPLNQAPYGHQWDLVLRHGTRLRSCSFCYDCFYFLLISAFLSILTQLKLIELICSCFYLGFCFYSGYVSSELVFNILQFIFIR